MQDSVIRPTKNVLFPCKICGKEFLALKTMKQHEKLHYSAVKPFNKPFKCNYCGKMYSHKQTLSSHLNDHIKPYVCCLCNQGFARPKEYDEHCLRFHQSQDTNIYCQECKSKFKTGVCLAIHRISCNRNCYFELNQNNLIQTVLFNRSLPLTSPKTVSTPVVKSEANTNRKKSEDTESSDSDFQVVVKKRRLSFDQTKIEKKTQSNLPSSGCSTTISPVVGKERTSREEARECPICKNILLSRKGYKLHLLTHSGNPSFCCRHCTAKFNSNQALFKHLRHLHGEKIGSSSTPKNPIRRKSCNKIDNYVVPVLSNALVNQGNHQDEKRIYVRKSVKEEPHVWPKVLMSRHLNDLIERIHPVHDNGSLLTAF